jgi:hypothetical protein
MNLATLLKLAPGKRYRGALVGAGQPGQSFIFQGTRNASGRRRGLAARAGSGVLRPRLAA